MISLSLLALLVPGLAGGDPQVAESPPRPTMRRILAVLGRLLPVSLDEEDFWDPAQRSQIAAQLRVLADSSAELERHASQREPTFRHLSRSLSRDIAEIERSYSTGRVEEARFFVLELTQNCVSCHGRLPAAGDFDLGEELTGHIEVTSLERREQVNLLFATRQFEAALAAWEAAFADPSVSPLDLDVSGELNDYLALCLRVKRDAGRSLRGLEKLTGRRDLPRYLRGRIRSWSSALEELKKSEPDGSAAQTAPSLARARQLVMRSDRESGFPYPREQLIYDLAASSELYRLIAAQPEPGENLAEAYFLLGAIETRSAHSYWIPQAEFHLETALRLSPGGPFALPAYELLEEYSVAKYGGTTQRWVPDEVKKRLVELQKLLERHERAQR